MIGWKANGDQEHMGRPGDWRGGRGLRRGALTVEAAVVVPLVVFVFATVITTLFYVHDRMYYQCAGYEAAIAGNAPATSAEQAASAARVTAMRRIEDQIMPGPRPSCDVEPARRGVTVRYDRASSGTWFGPLAAYKTEAKVARVRPERTIRLAWAAKRLRD